MFKSDSFRSLKWTSNRFYLAGKNDKQNNLVRNLAHVCKTQKFTKKDTVEGVEMS